MVGLRVVTSGVTIRNKGPETHHAVCVRRHLKGQEKEEGDTMYRELLSHSSISIENNINKMDAEVRKVMFQ